MRTEKPLLMLVNPAAGRSTSNAALGSAVGTFCDAGYAPTVYFTTAPGAAVEMTERLAPGYERMVCLGGDGTLSDTIAGLMRIPAERRPHLGYIPMGTANDVANTLGLPMRQPGRAVEKILEGDGMPYDVGEMTGVGFFTYIAAFGAFTEVSYKTDQELKKTLGHLAYVIEGINSLGSIKSYHARVEHDGGVIEGDFIYGAVSNALSVGGMVKMKRELVDLSDGKFEMLLVHNPVNAGDLNSIVGGLLYQDYDNSPCLTVVQSRRVFIEFDQEVPWTRDGENGGSHRTLELVCRPHAVEIFC